jgi:hypothetical protein
VPGMAFDTSNRGCTMEPIVERALSPAIVWVFIPLLAVAFWGVASVIKALRGVSVTTEEFEEVRAEVEQLRACVDELRRSQQQLPTMGAPNA